MLFMLKSLADRQTKEGSWQWSSTETAETVLPTLRSILACALPNHGVNPSVATLKRTDVFLESAACGTPEIPQSRFGLRPRGLQTRQRQPLACFLQYKEEPYDSPAMTMALVFSQGLLHLWRETPIPSLWIFYFYRVRCFGTSRASNSIRGMPRSRHFY